MNSRLREAIAAYDPSASLPEAATIPSAWYTDPAMLDLERRQVFARSWQLVARVDQVRQPGRFVTADVAGEPIMVVRGRDEVLRGFFNVCRHHAAEVLTEPAGCAKSLRCPYHGWTYSLEGELKGVPEFDGVRNFDKSQNGLVPIRVDTWEQFVFVCLDPRAPELTDFLGKLPAHVARLNISDLKFFERRTYKIRCNWKV
ncbi:MAG: Rieske (2Fe-2S) protein, partial [Planctomycetes bacterium]|nr:Rieske (2Fe-2S) protein [Planctomycetota bacterium]